MKRILIPAGGAVLATGLLAAGLAGTATAAPDYATDPMATNNADAKSVVQFWTENNNAALKAAKEFYPDLQGPKLTSTGGPTTDGKPGQVAPIGGEPKTAAPKVKNVNLPKSIGKVFFVTSDGEYGWCSATSIQSKYRNLVATAGHCVYDTDKNGHVMDNWVFVPGYYQGKAPWGIYVGKQAWTHYDFDVYEDYDKDYAFVTVYNGVKYVGEKNVTAEEYKKFVGPKYVKETKTKVTKEQYEKWVGQNGRNGKIVDEVKPQVTGPDDKRGVYQPKEVTKAEYEAAAAIGGPSVVKVGAQAFTTTVNISDEEAVKYKANGGKGDIAELPSGQKTLTTYFVKQWLIPGSEAEYWIFDYTFVIELSADAGRLGDNVGGQGFAWNQKTGQPVYAFGYPAGAHPDGDKAFTGITPKWCYGKTSSKGFQAAKYKVEEHIGLKCSMTQGSSGGPWVLKYNSAKRMGYVNGVTSLVADTDNNGRFDLSTSPYFDGETADIYKKAANVWSGKIVDSLGQVYK
ncbi:trypsin-like serine peptidase [Planobispora rosea]|uniref:trypsin-like serine peptidase n=1 Tax=Planobispora rosea TaxID=35762 RepID=UPI00083B8146|nr:trypsin-like peptidase domain-containing protein [Planobispora rosea]